MTYTPPDKSFASLYVQCQVSDVTGQLNAGYRVFDLRLSAPWWPRDLKNPQNYWFYHGPVSLFWDFQQFHDAAKAWLRAHPKEAIIAYVKQEWPIADALTAA